MSSPKITQVPLWMAQPAAISTYPYIPVGNMMELIDMLALVQQEGKGCKFCGDSYKHEGSICPKIKGIEFHPGGTLASIRIE